MTDTGKSEEAARDDGQRNAARTVRDQSAIPWLEQSGERLRIDAATGIDEPAVRNGNRPDSKGPR